jgi:hypothetical protein
MTTTNQPKIENDFTEYLEAAWRRANESEDEVSVLLDEFDNDFDDNFDDNFDDDFKEYLEAAWHRANESEEEVCVLSDVFNDDKDKSKKRKLN